MGEVGLKKDRAEGPSGQFIVQRDDHRSVFTAGLYVAPALADLLETDPNKRLDRLLARYDRQAFAQALSSRVAMIGGSISVGKG